MYWKEVPVQVQAGHGPGRVSQPLEPRFQAGVDSISMFDGSGGTDAYLDGWAWGPYFDVEGGEREAAEVVAARFNRSFPMDFVARIRELHSSGRRDPIPGAADHWMDDDHDQA